MKAFLAALALGLLAATLGRAQSLGNDVAGQALANRVCAECHNVGLGGQGSARRTAPAFVDIANMPSATELSLHAFLSTPHPNMPNLVLSREQQDDVIAYILGLRRSR